MYNPKQEEQNQLNLKMIEAQDKEFAELCFKIFEQTADGKRFMEIIIDRFLIDLPVADPNQSASYASWREGINHFIRSIRARAKEIKNQRETA